MDKSQTTIIFMGTPDFSTAILRALFENKAYKILAVVTQPDRPAGRKRILTASPIKQLAIKLGINTILQPEKLSGSPENEKIQELNPDLIITAAFGQFLPQSTLQAAKTAAINVHASLLPQHRGGAPVHRAIMNGDTQTGVSIMYMVKQMDAGDVIAQASIPIFNDENVLMLTDRLSILGRDLLMETLPDLITGKVQPKTQDESLVTVSPNISREDQLVDFAKENAEQIHNHVRGLYPTHPAYFVDNAGNRITLIKTQVVEQKTDQSPGTIVKIDKKNLWLAAANKTIVSINQLQPAGKKPMEITQFLNGAGNDLNDKLQFVQV